MNEQEVTLAALSEQLGRIERLLAIGIKNVLSTRELATLLDVTMATVRAMINRKDLPYYKCGGKIFFKREDVENWQLSRRIMSSAETQALADTYCLTGNKEILQKGTLASQRKQGRRAQA